MAVTKDGVSASGWAYVPDPEKTSTWKLNISDAKHVAAAVAALGKGLMGNKVEIPQEDLPSVKRKVRAAYKKFYPDNEIPSAIAKSLTEKITDAITSVLSKAFGEIEETEKVETIKKEQMVSYEVVYEPNTKDAHGEWMSETTLQEACDNFNTNLKKGVVKPNLFHLENTDAFTIESTWIQKEFDVLVEETGEKIKAGSWVCKIKYHNEDLWTLKKEGVIGGVSIGGKGVINKETGEITNVTFDGED